MTAHVRYVISKKRDYVEFHYFTTMRANGDEPTIGAHGKH